jgi:hypothetical protein
MIKEIVEAVSIPVMAKVRIGHFVEAQVKTSLLHCIIYTTHPSPRVMHKGHSQFFFVRVVPLLLDITKHWD